jgi:hypothetical protein
VQESTRDLLGAGAFLAGAAAMGWESFSDVYRGTDVGVAHNAVFYPRIVLTITAVLALVLAGRALLARARLPGPNTVAARRLDVTPEGPALSWRPVCWLIGASIAYVASMQVLGYVAATTAFTAVTPALLGFRRWKTLALVALLYPLGTWLLFAQVIRIPLPVAGLPGLG